MKLTLSVIKADIGGFVGHSSSHPEVMEKAGEMLDKAVEDDKLIDARVLACGDDLQLIMTHQKGVEAEEIHKLAWDVFMAGTDIAKKLKLYGAGQDILSDAFSGNVKGMGPGAAEMSFEERPSDPVIVFMADKTSPGAWNYNLYKIFADAFNTAGLVIDPHMHDGFIFEVLDLKTGKAVKLNTPEEIYTLLGLIGSPEHYVIRSVHRKDGLWAAEASTQKLSKIAGKYVGKDDPVLIVRGQAGLPAVGEILEAFSYPHIVPGWMRGSHNGPLMPVSFCDATPSRFDGPPRVTAAGFQLAEGKLVGPRDMFDDPSFDTARVKANQLAEDLRRHGPFQPARLPEGDMEYTTLPSILEKLEGRFE
ncbi:fructose 1,6-bisphosphatase [candidate division WOR-3 bacterium]|uniref:Fructose-1,6-bisphosphate aldolase/phosphatase n=1 Tax=candidate division WOR-3 bacterium TaxID=2052148 RepID=A0A9D5QBX9_UNCW3|nr:fructose 1,6-bisphosphatase [candidate division WOR-3 bacterium]MBD3364078.1 fructose 1,6-bisphosphatase [candidate division WOR-3 bacterium]